MSKRYSSFVAIAIDDYYNYCYLDSRDTFYSLQFIESGKTPMTPGIDRHICIS